MLPSHSNSNIQWLCRDHLKNKEKNFKKVKLLEHKQSATCVFEHVRKCTKMIQTLTLYLIYLIVLWVHRKCLFIIKISHKIHNLMNIVDNLYASIKVLTIIYINITKEQK